MNDVPPASLASLEPYPVPAGARLVFDYERWTTDGWSRGSVKLVFDDGRPASIVARNVPVVGDASTVRALGDYARLFPEPLPVAGV